MTAWRVPVFSGRGTRTAHAFRHGRPVCGRSWLGNTADAHAEDRRCRTCERLAR